MARRSKKGADQGHAPWVIEIGSRPEPMPEFREDCPCTKAKCERHSKCGECVEYHTQTKRQRAPFCMR